MYLKLNFRILQICRILQYKYHKSAVPMTVDIWNCQIYLLALILHIDAFLKCLGYICHTPVSSGLPPQYLERYDSCLMLFFPNFGQQYT